MTGWLPILLAITLAQASAPPGNTAAPRTLTIRYSDGRTTPRVVTAESRMWTPTFPHRGNTDRDGLALSALQIEHTLDKDVVVVSISLIYGQPHQRTVPVATVRVKNDQTVEVGQLAAFGVDPITLTVSDSIPATLVQPTATSVSSWLDVEVGLAVSDVPVYTITMRNRSPRPVRVLAFQLFRGGTRVGSGRRIGKYGAPLLEADGAYEFTFQAPSATGSHGFDRLDVVGVLWMDGSVEGDASLKTSEEAALPGIAQQLRLVIELLRGHPSATVADLRALIEALPIDGDAGVRTGRQQVKLVVLDDLRNTPGPIVPDEWINAALERYSTWFTRVAR